MIGGAGRRRRRGRRAQALPTSAAARRTEHSISCWYCDWKIYAFNDILFNLGWKHSRCMKAWFSVGVYFSLIALVGISLMILWDSVAVFYFGSRSVLVWLQNLLTSGLSVSIMDTAIIIISTVLSIAFHEFGHAIAAASEGVQIEYAALFVAVLFPGALVALNYDILQNLPLFSMLRIYCAGIWHNVTVVDITKTSPLSEYLSAHDVILSVDGVKLTRTDQWVKILDQGTSLKISSPEFLEGSQRYAAASSGKGYCVPNSWMDASMNLWHISDKVPCPDELIAFEKMICNGSAIFSEKTDRESGKKEIEGKYCLIAKDVVKLRKCGNGWPRMENYINSCVCFQDEYCLLPVLSPGFSWVEVSYARPYSMECLQKEGNISSLHASNNSHGQNPCEGSFVYTGDQLSSTQSIMLTPYRPRWAFLLIIADLPYILESGLSSLLHISAALAVVNCLPVYFLDGEAILETSLGYLAWFTRRQQRRILKVQNSDSESTMEITVLTSSKATQEPTLTLLLIFWNQSSIFHLNEVVSTASIFMMNQSRPSVHILSPWRSSSINVQIVEIPGSTEAIKTLPALIKLNKEEKSHTKPPYIANLLGQTGRRSLLKCQNRVPQLPLELELPSLNLFS